MLLERRVEDYNRVAPERWLFDPITILSSQIRASPRVMFHRVDQRDVEKGEVHDRQLYAVAQTCTEAGHRSICMFFRTCGWRGIHQ